MESNVIQITYSVLTQVECLRFTDYAAMIKLYLFVLKIENAKDSIYAYYTSALPFFHTLSSIYIM